MRLALIALLVAPIAAAQIVGDAHPVSEMHTDEPMKFYGWRFAANDDGGYALWSDGGLAAMAFARNGDPRPETRTFIPAPPGTEIIANDLIAANGGFYTVRGGGKPGAPAIQIRRSDGTAETTIPKKYQDARLFWNGSRFLVVDYWIGASAFVLDSDLRVITPRLPLNGWSSVSSAAPTANGFLLVGNTNAGMHVVRIDNDGTITEIPTPLETINHNGILCWSGSDYFVFWHDGLGGLAGAHLDQSGSMVGDIVDIDRSVKYGTANIIWDGAAYLVAWPEPVGKDPCVVHLVGRRIRQSVGTREVIDDVGGGLIAAGNTPFIVDAGCSSEGILGHRLGDAQRHQMSSGVLPQNPVGVASDGAEVAELWLERNKLLVGRASLDGTLLDGFGKLVSPNDLQYSPIAPQIVFGGVDYLIVWTENQKVMARLFSRDGAFRGDPLILATMRSYPAAVWTGTEFLVLWTGDEPGGAAITPTGVITPFHPFPAEESVGELALAVSNRGTLVAYASGASDHKTFIKTAMLQGHSFVARSTIAEESSALSQIGLPVVTMPHLASDGTTFLLGWTRQQDIYYSEAMIARLDATGARMTSPLEVADYYIVGKVILPAPLAEAHPQFDGKHYHVYTYGDEGIHGGVLPSGAFDCHCPVDLPRSPWLAYAARAGSGQLVVAEWLEVATPVGPPRRRAAFRLLDFTNVDEPRRRAVR